MWTSTSGSPLPSADEAAIAREIAHYRALPCVFDDFIDLPWLSDGLIHLVCTEKRPAIPEKKWVPAYHFLVCRGSQAVGWIQLRVGYGGGPHDANLYYGGQIGYEIDEPYRGQGYAGRACRLLAPVARAHQMPALLITNLVDNTASRRVCEKLGLRLLRAAPIPEWHDLHQEAGPNAVNIFEWTLA